MDFLVTKRVADLKAWNQHKNKGRERESGRESVREEGGRERPMPCFNGSSLIVFKIFAYWSVQLFYFLPETILVICFDRLPSSCESAH